MLEIKNTYIKQNKIKQTNKLSCIALPGHNVEGYTKVMMMVGKQAVKIYI